MDSFHIQYNWSLAWELFCFSSLPAYVILHRKGNWNWMDIFILTIPLFNVCSFAAKITSRYLMHIKLNTIMIFHELWYSLGPNSYIVIVTFISAVCGKNSITQEQFIWQMKHRSDGGSCQFFWWVIWILACGNRIRMKCCLPCVGALVWYVWYEMEPVMFLSIFLPLWLMG